MPKATGVFDRLHQDVHEIGVGDDVMRSYVYFRLRVEGQDFAGSLVVKQTVGSSFDDNSLEVTFSEGSKWPEKYGASELQQAARDYYRSLVGPGGRGISFGGNVQIRMRNNEMQVPASFEINV